MPPAGRSGAWRPAQAYRIAPSAGSGRRSACNRTAARLSNCRPIPVHRQGAGQYRPLFVAAEPGYCLACRREIANSDAGPCAVGAAERRGAENPHPYPQRRDLILCRARYRNRGGDRQMLPDSPAHTVCEDAAALARFGCLGSLASRLPSRVFFDMRGSFARHPMSASRRATRPMDGQL